VRAQDRAPDRVFVLRGGWGSEDSAGPEYDVRGFKGLCDALPLAAVVNGGVLCVHGEAIARARDAQGDRRVRPGRRSPRLFVLRGGFSADAAFFACDGGRCVAGAQAVDGFLAANGLGLIVHEGGEACVEFPLENVVSIASAGAAEAAVVIVDAECRWEARTFQPARGETGARFRDPASAEAMLVRPGARMSEGLAAVSLTGGASACPGAD